MYRTAVSLHAICPLLNQSWSDLIRLQSDLATLVVLVGLANLAAPIEVARCSAELATRSCEAETVLTYRRETVDLK